jgi:hypothetical protein
MPVGVNDIGQMQRDLDAKDAHIADLQAQLAEARAVVERCKWPMTADNVRIVPGMEIWYAGKDTDWDAVPTTVEWVAVACPNDKSTLACAFGDGDELDTDVFYSTREAAEAARGEKGGGDNTEQGGGE